MRTASRLLPSQLDTPDPKDQGIAVLHRPNLHSMPEQKQEQLPKAQYMRLPAQYLLGRAPALHPAVARGDAEDPIHWKLATM